MAAMFAVIITKRYGINSFQKYKNKHLNFRKLRVLTYFNKIVQITESFLVKIRLRQQNGSRNR